MEPTGIERKLTVILAADFEGYSRLMHLDEETTLKTLKAHRTIIDHVIAQHAGRVFNTAGDSVVAEFGSAVEALRSSIEIQQQLRSSNAELSDAHRMRLRIGINLGDVMVADDDLLGDGVNVAARLESLAEPGGICISSGVYNLVRQTIPVRFQDIGWQMVKNISEPIHVFRVVPEGTAPIPATHPSPVRTVTTKGRRKFIVCTAVIGVMAVAAIALWQKFSPSIPPADEKTVDSATVTQKPSIAVLPFANLSGDTDQEYFSDGITNDVITDLSKFHTLSVIASNSVFIYKGKPAKIQDVSRELGVRYVLEGSIQKASDKIRINVQLIDAATGHHLWAERYTRDLKDLFSLQDEIVQTIVRALAIRVDMVEQARAIRKDTKNLAAYDYVLRGRNYLERTTRSTNMAAQQMFQKAIDLDPLYASAYVGLGWTYRKAMGHGWTEFPDEALQRAQDLAQKALGLKESSAAYNLLASIYLPRKRYELAERALERAMLLNPNDWESRRLWGSLMLYTGRRKEAIEAFETTRRLNPHMDADAFYSLGLAYYLEGRYTDAIAVLEHSLGQNPRHPFLYAVLAASYAQSGRSDDAARAADMVHRLHPFFSATNYGTRFNNAQDRAHLLEGLQKAGLTQVHEKKQ